MRAFHGEEPYVFFADYKYGDDWAYLSKTSYFIKTDGKSSAKYVSGGYFSLRFTKLCGTLWSWTIMALYVSNKR